MNKQTVAVLVTQSTLARRQFLLLAARAAALAAIPKISWAQSYPTQPIRILVGFAAGGNFDIIARLLGQWLSAQLHQPVIVENRPGASSNIATEAVIRAPADGYTLLLGGTVNAMNATLYDKLGFNFIRDVAPVAGVVRFPNVMTVSESFPSKSVAEFIAYAKANPGDVNHGSSGNGTTQHLAGELFKMMTGVNFMHVPYRGGGPALADLIVGTVDLTFDNMATVWPMVQDGNARLYQARGFAAITHALKPGGRVTFWSAGPDDAFARRLSKAGFTVAVVAAKACARARRSAHTIFVADR